MSMFDSLEEYELYQWMLRYFVPSTSGMWGQPMFCFKPTTNCYDIKGECGCNQSSEFVRAGVFSEMMKVPDEVVEKGNWR